jgi:hypothetical protein
LRFDANLAFSRAFVSVGDFERSRSQESPLFRLNNTNFDVKDYARMEFSVGTGRCAWPTMDGDTAPNTLPERSAAETGISDTASVDVKIAGGFQLVFSYNACVI